MKPVLTRLDTLEKTGQNGVPLYLVTFDDSTTQQMNAVQLFMQRLDYEAGLPVPRVTETRLIRGDPSKFGRLSELMAAVED